MTLPQDSILTTLSGILMTGYFPGLVSMVQEHGTPTMQMIGTMDELANMGSNIVRYEVGASDSARAGAHIQRDFNAPRKSRSATLDFYYDPDNTNPQAQEFRGFDVSTHISRSDMIQARNGNGMYKLVDRNVKHFFSTLNEAPSFLLHSDKSARIGTVTGKKALGTTYAGAGTYSSGATSATILIGEHSIGAFKRDMVLDIYNASGVLVAGEVRVVRVDTVGGALGIQTTELSAGKGTDNLNSIAATNVIYRADEKDQGFACAINEIVKESYAGDAASNWMRKDRLQADNLIFVPEALNRAGEDDKEIDIEDLDDLANAYEVNNKVSADELGKLRYIAGQKLTQTLRRNAMDSTLSVEPVGGGDDHKSGIKRYVHTHPVMGDIPIEGDPTAREDRIILAPMDNIKFMYAGKKGPEVLSGTSGNIFERIPGTNAANGGSKDYRAEATFTMTPVVQEFSKFGATFNLTS